MGLIRKTLVTAVAAKVIEQARKPENQRKMREFIASKRKTRSTRPT
jgi:hypothetical protein